MTPTRSRGVSTGPDAVDPPFASHAAQPTASTVTRASRKARRPADLTAPAPLGTSDPNGGHSYELWAWYPCNIRSTNGLLFTDAGVEAPWIQRGLQPGEPGWGWGSWDPSAGAQHFVIKTAKNVRRPNECILVIDADAEANKDGHYNNWPDPGNNHGNRGFNIGFADGHTAFVPRGKELLRTYVESGNGNPNVIAKAIYQQYGYSVTTQSFGGKSVKVWNVAP